MSLKALSDYTFYSRYSQYLPDKKRRETWEEAVNRTFTMHRNKYAEQIKNNPELKDEIDFAEKQVIKKRVLGSQRNLQFGGASILKHELKSYNCSFSLCDRIRVFSETIYALLCGTGVGMSVQECHVKKLPDIRARNKGEKVYIIRDEIEGWADAFGVLISSFVDKKDAMFPEYSGFEVEFDFSLIRPKGSLIAGQFKAPGPQGLSQSLTKCKKLVERRLAEISKEKTENKFSNKLKPIDCYDFIAHMSDSVLSGGIRRSALLILFSIEDKEMMEAKTEDWFLKNPQRARSNNSVVLERGKLSKGAFHDIFKSIKQMGEPGFYFIEDGEFDIGANPCQPKWAEVLTKDGVKTIGDIQIGDEIWSTEGWTKVLDKWSNGIKEVFEYKTDNGSFCGTSKHKVVSNGIKSEVKNCEYIDTFLNNSNETEASKINSVTKISEEEVFDLTVDNQSHTYWTNNCNVSNCVEIGLYPKTEDGRTGFEMCVAGDTKLITRSGIKTIEEAVDSEIEIWNGENWARTIPFKTHDSTELYRVYFGDGSYLDVTLNHRFLIKHRFQKKYREVNTEYLINNLESQKYGISVPRSNVIYEDGIINDLAYVYGVFLGDGSAKEKFARDLKTYDSLPNDIYSWNRESILKFIAGWADTDGSQASNGIRIYASEGRIRDLQLLLTKVGIDSSVNFCYEKGDDQVILGKKAKRNKAIYYAQITRTIDIPCQRLSCENKHNAAHKGKDQIIKKVEKLEGSSHKAYCLEEKGKHTCLFNNVITLQCNLTEINGKFCKEEENFYQACRAAAIIGTLQAGYTDFKYLSSETKEIVDREALLGVSITGLMDNPELLFDPEIQKNGALKVKETNQKISKLLGINPAARTTCVKPSGSASAVLSTASGIHPQHARRYIRRVQSNEGEFCLSVSKKVNPLAVEKSVWSGTGTDYCVSFLCEVPQGAITKNQLGAIEFLEKIKTTQKNWVLNGANKDLCVNKKVDHNVSSTVVIKTEEWDEVETYIYKNRHLFTGISLLSASGDLDYTQAPFSTVLTPNELVREYGDASVFASGLVVAGLMAYNDNLWAACDSVLGVGEKLKEIETEPNYPIKRNNKQLAEYFIQKEIYEEWFLKVDWIRRVKQFAERYFEGDVRKATYCLKHVSLWKSWCDLKREYKDIDWEKEIEEIEEYKNADEQSAVACNGNSCELV